MKASTSSSSKVCPSKLTGSPTRIVNSATRVYPFDAASATAMRITPRCTTMPPLARPTRPRHP